MQLISLCGKEEQSDFSQKRLEPWVTWRSGSSEVPWGAQIVVPSKRGITHKVSWSTGLGEISLDQRHLSTSAPGKVLRELRKVNVLFLRSCLQGYTHIFQRK